MDRHASRPWFTLIALLSLALSALSPAAPVATAAPSWPAAVYLAGSLQSEIGCPGDWIADCPLSKLTQAPNGVYAFTSPSIPAGSYEYKMTTGAWTENYGANFQLDGPNIALNLTAAQPVRFYYDHKTHYIADSVRNTIYTVPGSFNSELGCPGDWQPDCLATLMSDTDGDGVFTFVTDQIPPGNYEFKVATNESWNNPNYGDGGGPNNVALSVSGPATVTISFNSTTKVPSVVVRSALPSPDNNVEYDGLRHDSRDTLYRTPGGAVPAGTPVTIRFRTFHNDVTAVKLRLYDLEAGGQRFVSMTPAATDVSCYQADLVGKSCDFWQATVSSPSANNYWYRFLVTDGSKTVYYGDDTSALDGGLGKATADPVDQSFALMAYAPGFSAPAWAKRAVIYQIFPERFRNGSTRNDLQTGAHRYDDPVVKLPWGTLPEGYCRNYTDAATSCPWRFNTNPPSSSPAKEQPSGRDYMGGDLKGVTQKLEYLQGLGINTIYFNPIFAAGSNHRYDTRDYKQIDPSLGTLEDFRELVKEAKGRGIRIILDGVFNHMSSDSANFDRYHAYATLGACESASSVFRAWFNFRAPAGAEPAPCAPSTAGGSDTYYAGWFGFDSIPEIKKSNPAVQQYFLTDPDSVSRFWLKKGAAGWRLDVMGDASFPNGYWEQFRQIVKQTDPNAVIIGELWQKDSTLLRYLRGDRADTTMNYRLRDAVLGLLTPGAFDSKGFGDSGRIIKPSEFASRVSSIREDYAEASSYSLMNLLDSHDTERLLWTLTPGGANLAEKEQNAANLANGKARQRLASLIQFTMPGAPTVYYGDEVGVTGGDDPDDRRTFPWPDTANGGRTADTNLRSHYATLGTLRSRITPLTDGDLRMLLADDANDTVAYGRKTGSQAAVVVINRSAVAKNVEIPTAGYLPNGVQLTAIYGVGGSFKGVGGTTSGGKLTVSVPALGGLLLISGNTDLTPPAAPSGLRVTGEGDGSVSVAWNAVPGAAGYNLYRSPVSGGGWVKVNSAPLTTLSATDSGLPNAKTVYHTVRALDAAGNESAASGESSAMPHLVIGWANLQWPPSISHTISVTTRTDTAYGQVYIDGKTNASGATPTLRAQLGFGPVGSDPRGANWTWTDAAFNTDSGNNDEFKASMLPETVGSFSYVYRYTTTNGRDWLYADRNGPIAGNALPSNPGALTVLSSGDTTAPAVPSGLKVTSASPDGVALSWDANSGDSSLYGYEVLRADSVAGPFAVIATVTTPSYTDTNVSQGASYAYAVRALDGSFNRSASSAPVTATAELRTVTLQFNVTVPASTDATGRSVTIAGFLDRLDGGLPQWNPAGVTLTRADATTWRITLTGKEGTQIEYKYAQGAWDYVEKDGVCGEVANRQLTLAYGSTGTQVINDTIQNWRNVAPCGN